MDAPENLRGYAGDPGNHNMHPADPYNDTIITPGSYTFLAGSLEAPLKEQQSGGSQLLQQAQSTTPIQPHEDGEPNQSSSAAAGSLIGTLFTNHLTPGSFASSRSPPNSWELTINGGSHHLYAGGSNMSNILINAGGMMGGGASSSTPTAQLLIGGLHGGSFTDNNDNNSSVYYPSSHSSHNNNQHAEAMQLIYVNAAGGYNHPGGFHPDGRGGSSVTTTTTLLYPENNNNSTSYGVSVHTPGAASMSQQRALEAAGAIPYNWSRSGGNEHSFLPVNNEEPQSSNHQSLFGAALGRHGDGHDLSRMHHTEHLQSEVGNNMHVDQGNNNNNNNNISVNGQGLLSLSLSSHQPHFGGSQLPESTSSEAAHMNAVAQAAALAKTKELASRYLASSGANADLSRFRTPSRDDVMGSSRFHQENHHGVHTNGARNSKSHVGGNNHASQSGPSNNATLSASAFLQSVQSILNELCKVTPLKRTPTKPASTSAEGQYPLRSSSASVNANYGYHGKEDSHTAMHAEFSTARGDPAGSLSDVSQLVTVSHIPLQPEMMQGLADAARSSGNNRDDLEFKKGQLIRMLDEVEARFRRYSDQLQVTCSGFNAQAGPQAATPYTILALQAMSRHFRCLKDAVKNQLKMVRRALGEEEVPGGFSGETSRLRYVDQQIRQQRALQQLGMLQQHAWRPQRGLPERAVSVLRAWLFEHFLHPYPKDVDKMSLAKQTGLTRSQVSNWFINARVRLWKPMVEEMYVEEQREAAELAMQSERMAREQANMHNNSPFNQQYEGINRGRSCNNNNNNNNNSTLQDELHTNGQTSSMQPPDQGRDQGPNVNNILTEVQPQAQLYRQQDAGEHNNNNNFHYEGREAKRSKTATLETVADAYNNNNNNNNTSMLIMHPEGENKPPNEGDDTDLEESRKLKGKAPAAAQESSVVTGAFVSYNDVNPMNNVHRYENQSNNNHAAAAGSYVAASRSSGVSLTLGLRHCDATNMRASTVSSHSVAPILEKYDVDEDIARMDPLDREEYLHEGGRIYRDVNVVDHNGPYNVNMQRERDQEENHHDGGGNLTQEVSMPGGTGMASPEFEHQHHHEFSHDHGN